jgi:membrane fusion protein (multidrug efflux system)
MRKRMMLTVAVLVFLLAGLGIYKVQQIRSAMAAGAAWQPPPEAVTTVVAHETRWPETVDVIGSVSAVHGVTLSADLPGTVESIEFQSGANVAAGAVIVRLDARQERAQLAAAQAQQELARLNLERMTRLRDKEVVAQSELDAVAAAAKQADARVGEIRATIERKQVRAPFAGRLGIRQVNLGQYLNAGEPIVPLQSLDPVYVDFSVPQAQLAGLGVGAEVRVHVDSLRVTHAIGRITAINSLVDEATRNVLVQATFRNPHAALRPGMFVEVEIATGTTPPVVALPASAVNYAPYGNSVFVVTTMKGANGKSYRGVEQRFVKLGAGHGDQVAVESGVKPGDEVVTSGVFKLRSGAAVLVNNSVQPANDPAPKPEDS